MRGYCLVYSPDRRRDDCPKHGIVLGGLLAPGVRPRSRPQHSDVDPVAYPATHRDQVGHRLHVPVFCSGRYRGLPHRRASLSPPLLTANLSPERKICILFVSFAVTYLPLFNFQSNDKISHAKSIFVAHLLSGIHIGLGKFLMGYHEFCLAHPRTYLHSQIELLTQPHCIANFVRSVAPKLS